MDSLYRRIRDRIHADPDRLALVHRDSRLTYEHIGQRVDALAHDLALRGIGTETIVAVYVEQPHSAIVSVLAVWAVGAAYLPLDPDAPDELSRSWMARVGAETIITEPALADRVAGLCPTPPVVTDRPGAPQPSREFGGPTHPRSLAYIIFTSGSTGNPKAIAVEQCNLLSYHDAFGHYVALERQHTVLQVAGFSFDGWIRDALMPLAVGARTVLQSRTIRRDPDQILAAVRRYGVTHLMATSPALVTGLLTAPTFAVDPPGFESILVAGESFLPLHVFGSDLRRFGRIINHYGLTETTMVAMWQAVTPDPETKVDDIGVPLPGYTAYLLDERMRPVAPRQIGEIYIGGNGVSRGYLGAQVLTADRFVADPFGAPGSRMCRTGDIGRVHSDGRFEFLGRRDRQINLRGYRVEPAHVEAAIRSHPAVATAAVVDHHRPSHGTILVAYVIPADRAPERDALRTHLAARLPAYMIPTVFVFMDGLPLGGTGKVDRSALPAPVFEGDASDLPADGTEQAVADGFAKILGVDEIGRQDNFFDLGGHSLLAAQIAAHLSVAFDRAVTTEMILRNPTVAALAAALPATAREVGIVRRSGTRYPLSLVQRGLLPATTAVTVRAFRLTGPLDTDRLTSALAEVVRRHAILRCTFDSRPDGVPTQTVRHRVSLSISKSPVHESGLAHRLTAIRDAPLDLAAGPPLEAEVFTLGPNSNVLLLRCHRLIADEASLDLMIREIGMFYNCADPAPAAPPVHYPSFVRTRAESSDGAPVALNYWQAALHGCTWADPSCPTVTSSSARFPATVVHPLRAIARAHRVELADVLRAAFAVAIAAISPAVGKVIVAHLETRRPRADLDSVIGPFAYSTATIVDPAGGGSFSALLDRIRTAESESRHYRRFPFEYLCGEMGLSNAVLANQFVLRSGPGELLRLSGVEATGIELGLLDESVSCRLILTEEAGALAGSIEYRHHEAERAGQLAFHLERIVRAIAVDPDLPLAAGFRSRSR
ncbi:amino acid adenylation domain-containing protein [Nocardia sienata]|uniref:amino acid adenylation domain-containing protein n=1 Tax=Nocardia sienata TaxID=248552 RepID=UPI0007A3CBDF|nr:amino acid adenylation domain-containing protein [Nocardia sienata]